MQDQIGGPLEHPVQYYFEVQECIPQWSKLTFKLW